MKNFRSFSEKFPTGLSKLHSTCPEENIEENYFCEKKIFPIFFGLSPKIFRRDCQNCIPLVYRNIVGFKKTLTCSLRMARKRKKESTHWGNVCFSFGLWITTEYKERKVFRS